MAMFRYYAANEKVPASVPAKALHTNFLRTGRIARSEEWLEEERRFLTHEEVAARTGARLENAGKKTHQRLNRFHTDIRFPKIIFHKTLAAAPHLGYVHVTASRSDFADHKDITWGFYIANFTAEISPDFAPDQATGTTAEETAGSIADGHFFHRVKPGYSRMYFAVAMKSELDGEKRRQVINREIRNNGVLFRTADPKTALKNVLMLGARTAELRKIVEAIG
ncbi:hypothetical protein SAMN05877838_0539 [Hoeflea halophila]|uniref:Uncharacterized protein n=1 Tax=Hoeflea halophila TaxID=714899 RepID=A0A286HNF2_9HYPH|nr:DUF6656 family protein [Hoeflea halophila]SOE08809.1 hypothetical protein SAMN05877838_0539 [Hoeflea halophila]